MQIILKYFSQVKRMNLWELLGTKDWIAHGQGKYKMGKTNTDIYMGIYISIYPFLFSCESKWTRTPGMKAKLTRDRFSPQTSKPSMFLISGQCFAR